MVKVRETLRESERKRASTSKESRASNKSLTSSSIASKQERGNKEKVPHYDSDWYDAGWVLVTAEGSIFQHSP